MAFNDSEIESRSVDEKYAEIFIESDCNDKLLACKINREIGLTSDEYFEIGMLYYSAKPAGFTASQFINQLQHFGYKVFEERFICPMDGDPRYK